MLTMRQTTKQFESTLQQLAEKKGITDLMTQVNVWAYPQENQCHMVIWRDSWKTVSHLIPNNAISVMIKKSYEHSGKYEIKEGEPTAKEIIDEIIQREKQG
jgi:hypothetical protein